MAFVSYLTYEEYVELGGKVSEDAFIILERKAQRWLDYFTFDRVKKLNFVPDEVKEVITDYVNRLHEYENQMADGDMISQYSNGVESITYRRNTEADVRKNLSRVAIAFLPDYLTNRGANFDVERYLQSANNNPQ